MAAAAPRQDEHRLWQSEILITDLVGRLIEFWGFKRNMGRVWAILYLRPDPQNANEIRAALRLSAGGVSMTLQELLRWGVVKRVWVPGDRRDYYTAEVQLWKMVSRVLSERERTEIANAIEACEQALAALESYAASEDAAARQRAGLQARRVRALLKVARLGKQLLDALLSTARVDAGPLSDFELADENERAND
jgi:DNA-binding transcriptional regulator GbsR (MarR family)